MPSSGAGLIKFGELFDQSYEQMAKGAFDAAVATSTKASTRAWSTSVVLATQRGTLWGQEGIAGNTVPVCHRPQRHRMHPHRERVPIGL